MPRYQGMADTRPAYELFRPRTAAFSSETKDGSCGDTLAAEFVPFRHCALRCRPEDTSKCSDIQIANQLTCIGYLSRWAHRAKTCVGCLYSGTTVSRYIPASSTI